LQLLINLPHAVRHHAVGNKVLAHVLRIQAPVLQAFNEHAWIGSENTGLGRSEEVNRLARNRNDMREYFFQRMPDAAQKVLEVGLSVSSAERNSMASSPPVRGVRERSGKTPRCRNGSTAPSGGRDIDNDYVEFALRRLHKPPAIRIVNANARVGENRGLRGKELARHRDQRRVQLNIIELRNGGMLQRFADRAIHAAADQQYRCGAGCSSSA